MRPATAQPPVPYTTSHNSLFARSNAANGDATQNMAAMGSVGTLFSIVDLTSTSTAEPKWRLYRKAKSGRPEDRVEVTSHAALDVLAEPNTFYSREELFEAGQQHVDLTGEAWLVITTSVLNIPASMWLVRPDRMTPVPSAEHFLAGYIYTGPDGEKIPLELDQVLRIKMPNPLDPYRGLGPVQSILADADSVKYSVEWNREFFRNGAEPGGIIQYETGLQEEEFQTLRRRWAEQHRGVSNAHRVAIIESGKWVDRKYSHTDMGFAQLREVSRDAIREAFRIHGHMLGDADDVNLANATAAEVTFARRLVVPRCNRWRGMLNSQFLPKFGLTAKGLEFDYDNPVAEDEATNSLNFLNWARGLQFLVASGYDGKQAVAASGLGELDWDADSVVHGNTTQAAGLRQSEDQTQETSSNWGNDASNRAGRHRVLNADPAPPAQPSPGDVDLTPVQEAWVYALNSLLATWTAQVAVPWRASLAKQIAPIIDSGDLTALADMDLTTDEAHTLLHAAMVGLADLSGRHVVQEAARQGLDITAAAADSDRLDGWSGLTADLLALGLRIAAAREAQRIASPDLSGAEVAHQVQQFLGALSDAGVRAQLGQALTAAQNAGRLSTFKAGPEASLYANEVNDQNTCVPCHQVDGRFLGTVSEMGQVERMYGAAGYVDCIGAQHGNSCRGTVVAVWRPKTTADGGDE